MEPQQDTAIDISTPPLSYNDWPIDILIQRETELTKKISNEGMMIDNADSADIAFLISQANAYQRISAGLSLLSKIIGGAGPIALVITTALNAPSYSNYIISGITACAVPLYHFSEKMELSSHALDKQARIAYNNNVLDLQKVRAARKKKQAIEAVIGGQVDVVQLRRKKLIRSIKKVNNGP